MGGLHVEATTGLNSGILLLRSGTGSDDKSVLTAIVSGIGRSGTSMVARVLDCMGVPMGKTNGLAVYEDREFLHALVTFDFVLMRRLIDQRNASGPRWGFKFPSLQNHLLPPQLLQFRRPHLIVVMRDPVALASRSFLSDGLGQTAEAAFANAMSQTADLQKLVLRAECPTLLLSYEKAIAAPETLVEALAGFCEVNLSEMQRRAAAAEIVPNHASYVELFHPRHLGYLDAVLDGCVIGWCKQSAGDGAVEVELLADGVVVRSGLADGFRNDLAAVGIGNHAFQLPVAGLRLTNTMVIAVRARGSVAMLDGSDRTFGELAPVNEVKSENPRRFESGSNKNPKSVA